MKSNNVSSGKVPLFHCTLTKNVAKIQKNGILILQTSNWVKSGDESRYGGGYIFAFTAVKDAYRWAFKWDWSINSKMGSGKISIVEFVDDRETWQIDDADPMSQAINEGVWLKKIGSIAPSAIRRTYAVTPDMVKDVVLRGDE